MPLKCLWYWLKGWTVQGLFKQKLCKSLLSWLFRKINGSKQRKIEHRIEEFVKSDNGQGSNRNYNDSLASINNASSSWFTRDQLNSMVILKLLQTCYSTLRFHAVKKNPNNWLDLNTENYNFQQQGNLAVFSPLVTQCIIWEILKPNWNSLVSRGNPDYVKSWVTVYCLT